MVVGAGAFGGWTALSLLRRGARVTLVDAWGAGNSRSSSGGETRVIRATYGGDRVYSEMATRALHLWRENERGWGERLFVPTGAVWMSSGDDDRYARDAVPILRDLGLGFDEMDGREMSRRFPQIAPDGIGYALFERDAGYLLARRGCQRVLRAFSDEGGAYRHAEVAPPDLREGGGGTPGEIRLSDGDSLGADAFVFAAGPWLSRLFPGFEPPLVSPTRQEVFYFGPPAGRTDLTDAGMPVWVESGESFFYGVPGSDGRGFKVADDGRGEPFDPTDGDRTPSSAGVARARRYMEARFPAMRGAPLLEARVCQYEQSPDGHLIADAHPAAENVWIAGGGSGHGYKHGPAFGEMLAGMVLGERRRAPGEEVFGLGRYGWTNR